MHQIHVMDSLLLLFFPRLWKILHLLDRFVSINLENSYILSRSSSASSCLRREIRLLSWGVFELVVSIQSWVAKVGLVTSVAFEFSSLGHFLCSSSMVLVIHVVSRFSLALFSLRTFVILRIFFLVEIVYKLELERAQFESLKGKFLTIRCLIFVLHYFKRVNML